MQIHLTQNEERERERGNPLRFFFNFQEIFLKIFKKNLTENERNKKQNQMNKNLNLLSFNFLLNEKKYLTIVNIFMQLFTY